MTNMSSVFSQFSPFLAKKCQFRLNNIFKENFKNSEELREEVRDLLFVYLVENTTALFLSLVKAFTFYWLDVNDSLCV